jgi:hypothetical protein
MESRRHFLLAASSVQGTHEGNPMRWGARDKTANWNNRDDGRDHRLQNETLDLRNPRTRGVHLFLSRDDQGDTALDHPNRLQIGKGGTTEQSVKQQNPTILPVVLRIV